MGSQVYGYGFARLRTPFEAPHSHAILQGSCDRGAQCTFAHSKDELLEPGRRSDYTRRGDRREDDTRRGDRDSGGAASSNAAASASLRYASARQRQSFPGRKHGRSRSPDRRRRSPEPERRRRSTPRSEGVRSVGRRSPSTAPPSPDASPPVGSPGGTSPSPVEVYYTPEQVVGKAVCLTTFPYGGPMIWVGTQTDASDEQHLDLLNVKVIVRCKSGGANSSIFYISQIGAPFLDEIPGGKIYSSLQEMMAPTWNVCTQVHPLSVCNGVSKPFLFAAKCIGYDCTLILGIIRFDFYGLREILISIHLAFKL